MNSSPTRSSLRWFALAAALLGATGAAAEKNGVKVGEGRLHPMLGLETQYDSLVVTTLGSTAGDLVLHVRPGLTYDLESSNVSFALSLMGDWNQYTGLEARGTRSLSYFGGDAALSVNVNPRGAVGLHLGDNFSHGDRITAVGLGAGVRSAANEAFIRVPIRPGGGALEITPGYAFAFEAFQHIVGAGVTPDPGLLNYLSHRPALEAKWKFLPKTAVVLDVQGDLRQYGSGGNPPVNALYARMGLSGLLTPKVALVLAAGYGNAFAEPTVGNYESVIGQLEFSYIMSPTSRIKAGYSRSFEPVPQLGWYGDNRGYAAATALLGGSVLLDVRVSLDFLDYAPRAGAVRNDLVVTTEDAVTWRAAEWLDVAAGYALSVRASSTSAAPGELASYNYARHQVFLRGTLRY